jgi:hypothetical protein
MRNVIAVIGGFVVWSALWLAGNAGLKGSMPARFDMDGFTQDNLVLGLAIVLSVLCSLVGGWVTGRLAVRPAAAGAVLGVLLLAVGIVVQSAAWSRMPLWYHLIFLALLVPMARSGARRGGAGRSVMG